MRLPPWRCNSRGTDNRCSSMPIAWDLSSPPFRRVDQLYSAESINFVYYARHSFIFLLSHQQKWRNVFYSGPKSWWQGACTGLATLQVCYTFKSDRVQAVY